MPTVLRVGPHRFFFYSNEGTEPPHVHVDTAGKTAKFWLGTVVLADSSGYSSRELSDLLKIVVDNAALFRRKWDEHFTRR